VKVLLVVDLVLVVMAGAIWLATRGGDEELNVANSGLRGSLPPAGQNIVDLSEIQDIDPPMPIPAELRGRPVVLMGTCVGCRSGDLMGGFLGRLKRGSPAFGDARTEVLIWGDDVEGWYDEWSIPPNRDAAPFDNVTFHVVRSPAAIAQVRRKLGIGPVRGAEESGITYVHDSRGRWRSTFFLGQLDRDDITHDVDAMG